MPIIWLGIIGAIAYAILRSRAVEEPAPIGPIPLPPPPLTPTPIGPSFPSPVLPATCQWTQYEQDIFNVLMTNPGISVSDLQLAAQGFSSRGCIEAADQLLARASELSQSFGGGLPPGQIIPAILYPDPYFAWPPTTQQLDQWYVEGSQSDNPRRMIEIARILDKYTRPIEADAVRIKILQLLGFQPDVTWLQGFRSMNYDSQVKLVDALVANDRERSARVAEAGGAIQLADLIRKIGITF